MSKVRKSPYDVQYVANRDSISIAEAEKVVMELKNKTSGSISSFINRYGEEIGRQKYK